MFARSSSLHHATTFRRQGDSPQTDQVVEGAPAASPPGRGPGRQGLRWQQRNGSRPLGIAEIPRSDPNLMDPGPGETPGPEPVLASPKRSTSELRHGGDHAEISALTPGASPGRWKATSRVGGCTRKASARFHPQKADHDGLIFHIPAFSSLWYVSRQDFSPAAALSFPLKQKASAGDHFDLLDQLPGSGDLPALKPTVSKPRTAPTAKLREEISRHPRRAGRGFQPRLRTSADKSRSAAQADPR